MSELFENAVEFVLESLSGREERGRFRVSLDALERLKRSATGAREIQTSHTGGVPLDAREAVSVPGVKGSAREPVSEGARKEAIDALRLQALACTKCPGLAGFRKNVVFGEGKLDAEVLLVGEAPGAAEDGSGEPFADAAGELLGKMLVAMGLSRELVYLAYAGKCRPDVLPEEEGLSRKASPEEIARCAPYLERQIELVRPRVVVVLGAPAAKALLGAEQPVAKLRSGWHEYRGIPVKVTHHPSHLIQNPGNAERRKVWEDLLEVLERLGHPVSEKQRGYFLKAAG